MEIILAILSTLALVLTWLGNRAVVATLDRGGPRPAAARAVWPGISILKPVKGLDEGLRENLASIAQQVYPGPLEILIGAADAGDPALVVARSVAADHPCVSIRVIVCPDDGGLNPKVSILRALSARAAHEHWLISDSNVRVGTDYVLRTAAGLTPGVGMCTNLIVGVGARSLGARLENLHLCTFVARAVSFAGRFGRACVVGKSMLFRRSDLERVGGWALVRDVLAEDYVLGNAFERAGRPVVLVPYLLRTYNRDWPLGRFTNRHLRWAQMRRRMCLLAFLAEPLTNPAALLVGLGAAAVVSGVRPTLWLLLVGLGLGTRLFLDESLLRRMTGKAPSFGVLLLALAKDVGMIGLWAIAAFRRTVDWRGTIFRIGAGTRLERSPPVPEPIRLRKAA